ncbi:MAG: 6-phosphofructokinase [Chloroflexi bacterium HGW-Chloroflexi-5]|jgi:6-phosphofructokinase 1|nr:MAG: 6-phosphofructokinase [Chloroflexi bacterium HGW-Chloroflexi-5]
MEESTIKTIGVMTSGGDAPGMNPFIRAVVRSCAANGIKTLGIEGGFEGLIHGKFREMGVRDVSGILQRGGTILQTARSLEFREPSGQREAVRQINNAGMDAVIVAGGDGSLNGAQKLVAKGIPVVGVPASIDNDIYGTDMCIGVDTALNTIVDAIDKIRDTASSHNRAFLIETMGRASGYLAIQAGIICGAELVLIPEHKTAPEEVAKAIEESYRRGKSHAIIVVAEGYEPHALDLAAEIDAMDIGFSTRVTILGHIQRGGKPSAFDRLLATRFGVTAVEFLLAGKTNVMTALQGTEMCAVPIDEVISNTKVLSQKFIEMTKILAK